MKTLTIYMLSGEDPYQAFRRMVKVAEQAFGVDVRWEVAQVPGGASHVTIDFFVNMVATYVTEAQWEKIEERLQAIAERVLRGDGA